MGGTMGVTLLDLIREAFKAQGVDADAEAFVGAVVKIQPSPHAAVVSVRPGSKVGTDLARAWVLEIEP